MAVEIVIFLVILGEAGRRVVIFTVETENFMEAVVLIVRDKGLLCHY